MKMKLVSLAFFLTSGLVTFVIPTAGIFLPFIFGAAFAAYGIVASFLKHLDPLNDAPNALRVFLASLGGIFMAQTRVFIFPSAGILLLIGALFLNDEFQRRAIHATRTGRRGGTVAFLGIDGSGKSSHSVATGKWLQQRGYSCTIMPFHRYLFVERLAAISKAARRGAATSDGFRFKGGGNPLRPILSLLDNVVLQISSSIGCRLEGRIVIYDRFIWSTYIKYKALDYPVRPISALYLSPRPTLALVLDIPIEKSMRVIDERVAHIHYPGEVLESERRQYLEIARRHGYPVIPASADFDEVQDQIQSHLASLFPPAGSTAGSN